MLDFSNIFDLKKDFHSWKNLTKKDIYLRKVNYKNEENEWKKDSITNSSTLSFHIKVYEKDFLNLNYGTKDEGLKRIKKEIVSRSVIQNPFEFSRHQENDHTDVPEVAQYKASQQLYNPNQMDQWALLKQDSGGPMTIIAMIILFAAISTLLIVCCVSNRKKEEEKKEKSKPNAAAILKSSRRSSSKEWRGFGERIESKNPGGVKGIGNIETRPLRNLSAESDVSRSMIGTHSQSNSISDDFFASQS
uniref:Uncharacterized protein n=1 Tax=Panagrolaimus sp. PS1159 TaxID=55785 RepID=A0AC35FUS1_9BILA